MNKLWTLLGFIITGQVAWDLGSRHLWFDMVWVIVVAGFGIIDLFLLDR